MPEMETLEEVDARKRRVSEMLRLATAADDDAMIRCLLMEAQGLGVRAYLLRTGTEPVKP